MHGRRQAIIVVLLSGFLPALNLLGLAGIGLFISAATVALVCLRLGSREGGIVLLWALLPAALIALQGDLFALYLLLGSFGLALRLRQRASWPEIILLATGLGVLIQLSLALQPGYLAQLEVQAQRVFDDLASQGATQVGAQEMLDVMVGFYGAFHVLSIVGSLILARWWQAMLYNPGGFRAEFHALRFDPRAMLALVGLLALGMSGALPGQGWGMLFTIPPLFGGLAAMHGVVGVKKLGAHWLALGYLTLVLMYPGIVALGLMDSVFDFRKRVAK